MHEKLTELLIHNNNALPSSQERIYGGGHCVIRVSRFFTFFCSLLVFTIYGVKIVTETHCKNFLKNIEFFIPGEDYEIFWGVNEVTRKVRMLHN